MRKLGQSHRRLSAHPFSGERRRRCRSDLAAQLVVAGLPRILTGKTAVEEFVAAIVEMRCLNVRALRQCESYALCKSGASVEIARERMRHVLLKSFEVEQRRKRQSFVVDGEAIRHRPSAPREQRSRGVIAAKRRRADRPVELTLPLQVGADRTNLFANPCVQCRPRQRIRRRPQRTFVLARRRQKKLSDAKLEAAARHIEISFGESGAFSTERRRLVTRQT